MTESWITNENLKAIVLTAVEERTNVLFTEQQWAEVKEFCPADDRPAWDPNRALSSLLGPEVIVVDEVDKSTPYRMGLLPQE